MSRKECIKEILLSEYLDGELPADAIKNVSEHLSSCHNCSATYDRMKTEHRLLLECLPDANPPAHMKELLLRKINAASQCRESPGILRWIGPAYLSPSTSRAWAIAAACVFFLAVLLSAFQVQRHFENKKILAEIDRSAAKWAARDFSLNPFNIDVQGVPLQVTTENPFKYFLNER